MNDTDQVTRAASSHERELDNCPESDFVVQVRDTLDGFWFRLANRSRTAVSRWVGYKEICTLSTTNEDGTVARVAAVTEYYGPKEWALRPLSMEELFDNVLCDV